MKALLPAAPVSRPIARPVRESFLIFGNPVIAEDEIAAVVEVLRSGWIGSGPRVQRFQEEFAKYVGAANAVALSSCTASLHLAMLAAGIGPGDEVITTPMTFCATANAIIHCGATPIFADCGRWDMNIDPAEISREITPRTKAILPVHFAGRPCDMKAIMSIASAHGLHVIEDCAHAIETEIDGKHAGTFGDFGCFSFYVTKNVTTADGGMVISQSAALADRVKTLGLHGLSRDAWTRFRDEGYKHYEVSDLGFKYNMTDIQAALGIKQLEKIERRWLRREEIWNRYQQAFADLPVMIPPPVKPGERHAYHLYTLLIDSDRLGLARDQVLNALLLENIGTGVHYLALHTHPYYAKNYQLNPGDFPNALYISDRTLSLPLSAKLSDEDVEDVISAVRKILIPR